MGTREVHTQMIPDRLYMDTAAFISGAVNQLIKEHRMPYKKKYPFSDLYRTDIKEYLRLWWLEYSKTEKGKAAYARNHARQLATKRLLTLSDGKRHWVPKELAAELVKLPIAERKVPARVRKHRGEA